MCPWKAFWDPDLFSSLLIRLRGCPLSVPTPWHFAYHGYKRHRPNWSQTKINQLLFFMCCFSSALSSEQLKATESQYQGAVGRLRAWWTFSGSHKENTSRRGRWEVSRTEELWLTPLKKGDPSPTTTTNWITATADWTSCSFPGMPRGGGTTQEQ